MQEDRDRQPEGRRRKKTTTTINLAAGLARAGHTVLVGQMDSQPNLSSTLDPEVGEYTMADVLHADRRTRQVVPGSLASAIVPSGPAWPDTLSVVPGSIELASRDDETHVGAERRLAITSDGALDDTEIAIWDLPPSLGQLTINGLVAADEVWIVTTPTRYGLEGIADLIATVELVQMHYNPDLVVGGIIVNMYYQGRTESIARHEELVGSYGRRSQGGLVYDEVCNHFEVVNKAIGAAAPLWLYGSEGQAPASWYESCGAAMLAGRN
ncbi:ParA family protein [Nonomuraea salmonea]|uniref:ParA family protein n=1 Tax=Nonomuraea salmonea TaxID=46181 RepID=UPI0031EABBBC